MRKPGLLQDPHRNGSGIAARLRPLGSSAPRTGMAQRAPAAVTTEVCGELTAASRPASSRSPRRALLTLTRGMITQSWRVLLLEVTGRLHCNGKGVTYAI